MKATLEFNMPDEEHEFQAALEGMKWKTTMQEFDQYLRDRIKHEEMGDAERSMLKKVRNRLNEMADFNLYP
jgi:hypothetical protein